MDNASGKFVVRMPSDMHRRIRKLAQNRRMSLNDLCIKAIDQYINSMGIHVDEQLGSVSSLIGDIRFGHEQNILAIVLFGSGARNEMTEMSDVDLLIVLDTSIAISRELYVHWQNENSNDAVSPHFVHTPKSVADAGSLWYEVALDGIILFQRDLSVSRFLNEIRHAVADRTIVRRIAYGHAYWIKEPKEAADAQ